MDATIDIVIPVYRPGKELHRLLGRLLGQTVRPQQILLVITEPPEADPAFFSGFEGDKIRVVRIDKREFDHGGTRHMAASMLRGDLLVFLTQDAMPADDRLLEKLTEPFSDLKVCASYARQLPRRDCSQIERYARSFNYGPDSRIKTEADLGTLGIKTFFCSNVCAAWRRSAYEELGGFERHTIFNEDMILAARLIQAHKAIAYCAEACVIHSHNYTGAQQFHRNFDLGVSQAQHPEIFAAVPSEGEGVRMVKQTAALLIRSGHAKCLPRLFWQSGCKYLGYRLGKSYRSLPGAAVCACSMNKAYWDND